MNLPLQGIYIKNLEFHRIWKKRTEINENFLCPFVTWLPNDFITHLADGLKIQITCNIIPCTIYESVDLDTFFISSWIIWFTVVKGRKFYRSGLCRAVNRGPLKGLISLHVLFENSLSACFNPEKKYYVCCNVQKV